MVNTAYHSQSILYVKSLHAGAESLNRFDQSCSLGLERLGLETFKTTGAALLDNNEATAKSTSQDGGIAVNFG